MREAEIRPQALFSRYLETLDRDCRRFFADRSQFVDVPCVGCGEKAAEPAFEKLGFRYVTCGECGSLYVSPRPSAAALNTYYEGSEAVRFWSTDFYRETAEARREKLFRPRAALVGELVGRAEITPDTFVDVGAGYGLFLEEVARLGLFREVVGVEPAVNLAAVCRDKGFRVIEKRMEAIEVGEVEAYVVTAFEVLEHVAEPLEFLKGLGRVLSPRGVMLVTTLTVSGFDIQTLWERSKSVSPPQHINFLSLDGIERLAGRAGLSVVELTTPGRLDVDIVANALAEDPTLPVPRVVRSLLELGAGAREEFQAFLQRHRLSSHMRVVARVDTGRAA